MINKKKHLSKEERFFIEKMLRTSTSFKAIANLLDRGLSTISEEINRNGGRTGYKVENAQNRANMSQIRKKLSFNKVLLNRSVRNFVEKELHRGLSPEKISSLTKRKNNLIYVSPKSIRKYISYNTRTA